MVSTTPCRAITNNDVPAVLDTIVNLFPHNIAIVLQLFQETSPRSLPDWEANLGMPGCAGVWPMLLAVFAVHAQG